MKPGSVVEVRSRFDGGWVSGFQVVAVEHTAEGETCRVRRTSDGAVLPVPFSAAELRELSHRGLFPRSASPRLVG
jgi:hypothetical protein